MARTAILGPVTKEQRQAIRALDPYWSQHRKDREFPAWVKTDGKLATDVMIALCVRGFGRERCPSISEWACFGVVTGVVGAVTDNAYIIAGEDFHFCQRSEVDYALFQILKEAAERDASLQVLDPAFVDIMCFLTLPRVHDMTGEPLSDSYSQSVFRSRWLYLQINPVPSRSVGFVGEGWHKECEEVFPKLPAEAQRSINLCAPMIRAQTDYICQYIKGRYRW